jgi:hypothetical protein
MTFGAKGEENHSFGFVPSHPDYLAGVHRAK